MRRREEEEEEGAAQEDEEGRRKKRLAGRKKMMENWEKERAVWSGGVNMINPLSTSFRDASFSHFQPH